MFWCTVPVRDLAVRPRIGRTARVQSFVTLCVNDGHANTALSNTWPHLRRTVSESQIAHHAK